MNKAHKETNNTTKSKAYQSFTLEKLNKKQKAVRFLRVGLFISVHNNYINK